MKKDNQSESTNNFDRYLSISKEYESMDELVKKFLENKKLKNL